MGEQGAAAARESVIRMGPRLGVLAGQEENCFQEGGLEDAVAACEALMPKLEQRAQEALAAREQAENHAADWERQLLDGATLYGSLTTIHNATSDRTAGLEGPPSAGGRRVVSASGPRQTCVERGKCTVM